MTLEELLKNWESESNAANDCIIEILESYMEFLDWVIGYVEHGCNVPEYKVKWFAEKTQNRLDANIRTGKESKGKSKLRWLIYARPLSGRVIWRCFCNII